MLSTLLVNGLVRKPTLKDLKVTKAFKVLKGHKVIPE
jgi:hypothetical protein